MYLILYVVVIVIMSYFIMFFVSDDKNKDDQSNNLVHFNLSRLSESVNCTIIGSDNGLSPGRRWAIIWTNVGIVLIGPLRTNINEILIEIYKVAFQKMHLKIASAICRPFCLAKYIYISRMIRIACVLSWVIVLWYP